MVQHIPQLGCNALPVSAAVDVMEEIVSDGEEASGAPAKAKKGAKRKATGT